MFLVSQYKPLWSLPEDFYYWNVSIPGIETPVIKKPWDFHRNITSIKETSLIGTFHCVRNDRSSTPIIVTSVYNRYLYANWVLPKLTTITPGLIITFVLYPPFSVSYTFIIGYLWLYIISSKDHKQLNWFGLTKIRIN